MKKIFLLIIYFLLSILICTSFAQKRQTDKFLSTIPTTEDYVLNNSSLGKEFWIAIPQNMSASESGKAVAVEIVVTSPYKTKVTLEIPEVAFILSKIVEPYQQVSFSSTTSDISFNQEVTESEMITHKGIHLYAEKPFTAVVINARDSSAEGYQAIPVSRWGTEHYHCSYYDFFETNKPRGGGFIVVASEPNTNVQIKLNGLGQMVGQTVMGRKIGQTISVTLNAGDTYMVRGDGMTKGEFDLTGTKITSNKPTGVISFHMRTMIPSLCPDDRNTLMEMYPSVDKWGYNFVTVQFDRKQSGDRQGKGDLFRILVSEDATSYNCDFYDLSTYNKAGTRSFTLNKAAMFNEIDAILDINNANKKKSVYGISVWSTNKPSLLVQNAFSNKWDGDDKWSPLNLYVAPIEEYVRSCIFTTPQTSGFLEHQLTLIAVGEPDDVNAELIRSIILDDKELWRTVPQFLQNRVPNTNLWWVRLGVSTGTHKLRSKTKIYAYLNGFDAHNSYAYPVAQNFNILNQMDTAAPIISKTMNCGDYTIDATELTNGKTGDNPKQVDLGLSEIILLDSLSFNYQLTLDKPEAFKPQLKIVKQKFFINLVDRRKQAKAVFVLLDRAGNLTIDSVIYNPDNVNISPSVTDFGKVRFSTAPQREISIQNSGKDVYRISAIHNRNSKFRLSQLPVMPYLLASGETLKINISYTPVLQSPALSDIDTIFITSDCLNIDCRIVGKVIFPTVTVDQSYDFGRVKKGVKVCLEDVNKKGLKVKNNGTDKLTVNSFTGIDVPFLLTSPVDPLLPVNLAPGDSVYFKSFCFVPQDSGKFETIVTAHTDAISGDSLIKLISEGMIEITPSVASDNTLNDIIISPNPASENLEITISRSGEMKRVSENIRIYDLMGHPITKYSDNLKMEPQEQKGSNESYITYKIDISNLTTGIYFVMVGNTMKKFVKI